MKKCASIRTQLLIGCNLDLEFKPSNYTVDITYGKSWQVLYVWNFLPSESGGFFEGEEFEVRA